MHTEMHIDCGTCPVRQVRCDDCVVNVLYQPQPALLPLDAAERAAVTALVAAGMVSAREASQLKAEREPWGARAVG